MLTDFQVLLYVLLHLILMTTMWIKNYYQYFLVIQFRKRLNDTIKITLLGANRINFPSSLQQSFQKIAWLKKSSWVQFKILRLLLWKFWFDISGVRPGSSDFNKIHCRFFFKHQASLGNIASCHDVELTSDIPFYEAFIYSVAPYSSPLLE